MNDNLLVYVKNNIFDNINNESIVQHIPILKF